MNLFPYLKKLLVCKRHDSLKYDHTGAVHIFLHGERKSRQCSETLHEKIIQPS